MIGFQWIAIDLGNGKFLCSQTGMLSLELSMYSLWDDINTAKGMIEQFEKIPEANEGEYIFTKQELDEISYATNCIDPNTKGYHKHASDGVVVIPKTHDKFMFYKDLFLLNY